MADPITDYYASEGWSGLTNNQRDWYVPDLLEAFYQRSFYGTMVPVKYDHAAVASQKIIFTGMWKLEPNWNPLGTRDIWLKTMYPATWRQEITVAHYGEKLAVHKWDPIITYWQSIGKQTAALAPLARTLVADSIIEHQENHIRNIFATLPMRFISDGKGGASGTGFNDIAKTDVYCPALCDELNLAFDYTGMYQQGEGLRAVMLGTPGQHYSARKDEAYQTVRQYANPRALLNYEVGDYAGVAHTANLINVLYNHGAITKQCTIAAALNPGDGANPSALVDGVRAVGETSGVTNYVQLSDFDAGDYLVNDIVTFHKVQSPGTTAPYTVANAPIPTDGYLFYRRVVSVNASTNRIVLDRPVQKDYSTDLGGGVYGYVTKGLHIHMAVVMAAPGAVVGGVAVPPQVYFPAAIDDVNGMYRISWDGYYGFSLFRPEVAAVVYSSGPVSVMGVTRYGDETS